MQEALNLAACGRTNPGKLGIFLLAWTARGFNLDEPMGGRTLLHQALQDQKLWLVNGLLAAGADPMALSEGIPASLTAAYYNESQAFRSMLATGRVRVNESDANGNTAGHFAASNGNEDLLNDLLKHQANLLLANHLGSTAMDLWAAHEAHSQPKLAERARIFANTIRPQARTVVLSQELPKVSPSLRPKVRF